MEAALFRYDSSKAPHLDWRAFWAAVDAGRDVVVEGFTDFSRFGDRGQLERMGGRTYRGRLRLRGCHFPTFVDFADATFERTLSLVDCHFWAGLRLHDASVAGRCTLRGSTVDDADRHWLDWRGLTTGGDLRLQGVTAKAPIDLYGARVGADLRLDGLHALAKGPDEATMRGIEGLNPADRHHAATEMVGKALNLEGARVEGHVYASPFTLGPTAIPGKPATTARTHLVWLKGTVDLRAKVTGQVDFDNATVEAGADKKAVWMAEATVGGSVFFVGGTRVTGSIDLRARVAGYVTFDNATVVAGADKAAVWMAEATVGGSVFFCNGTRVTGSIDLRANVEGSVDFDNATVEAGADKAAVWMAEATVGGSVFFRNGTRVTGWIDLRAKVTGQVNFNNATVEAGSDKMAVWMDAATVGGSVFFRNGTRVIGWIDLRAKVTGQVNFDNATVVAGADKKAVDMDAATVGGSVFFQNGTRVTGWIVLRAKVTGGVEFDNATVEAGADQSAVVMDAATVSGSVFFQNGTRVTGSIDLRAKVTGQVAFNNATVEAGADKMAVWMAEATVGGSVFFVGGTRVTGSIDLRAKVTGQVNFDNATVVAGADKKAVDMEAATVGDSVFMRGGTAFAGRVSMLQATLGGGLFMTNNINRSDFRRPRDPDPTDRVPRECLIAGDLDLGFVESGTSVVLHGVSVLGTLRARHLSVKGDLNICGGAAGAVADATLASARDWFEKTRWLTFMCGELRGRRRSETDVSYRDFPFDFWIELEWIRDPQKKDYVPDRLGWYTWELDSTSKNHKHPAIDLELAHVRGHLWIRGQRVLGGVKANLAHVEGDASFDRSLIEGDLDLRDARVEGAFGGKPAATGEPGPLVRGVIDARGATFNTVTIVLGNDPSTNAHAADDHLFDNAKVGTLRISGDMPEAERATSDKAGGRWSLHRLRFDEIEVDDSEGGKPSRCSLHEWKWAGIFALGTVPAFVALWQGGVPDGSLILVFAAAIYAVTVAVAACRVWPHGPDGKRRPIREVLLDGNHPRRPILGLLRTARFSAALHVDVEHWARAAGDDPIADEAFLMRRRRELRERRPRLDKDGRPERGCEPSHYSWFQRGVRWALFDIPFGYGVRWPRALHLFALLWLLNWAVFLPAAAVERTGAARSQAMALQAKGVAERPWGPQKAFFMAMRVQVPPVELFIDAEWKPADRAMFGGGREGRGIALTYENWAAVMRILNLVLVPVIIAGATGLLKPREGRYTGAA